MPFKRFIEHTKKKPTGQAMVEFAIVLTVMMGLFVGTFEIMVLFRKRTDLATATRMAARQASELWIDTGTDMEDEIQNYVWDEMEKMGYAITWMDGTDDPTGGPKVRSTVEGIDLETVDTDLEFIADGSSTCTYGQYIQVSIEMDWTFAVLPLDTFFKNAGATSGVIEENALVRCWRGE